MAAKRDSLWTLPLGILFIAFLALFLLKSLMRSPLPRRNPVPQIGGPSQVQPRPLGTSYAKDFVTQTPKGLTIPLGNIKMDTSACSKGVTMFTHAQILAELPGFLKVYDTRPAANPGGTGIHHQFALWCFIRRINPTHIIETGIHQGMGTWLLRKAAPNASYIGLEPKNTGLLYRDLRPDSVYLTDKNFRDFGKIDFVKEFGIIPESTVVFLDDHQHEIQRVLQAMKNKIRHVIADDNYEANNRKQSPSNLSLKIGCDVALGKHTEGKDFGFGWKLTAKMMEDSKFVFNDLVEEYFEFPPLWKRDDSGGRWVFDTADWRTLFTSQQYRLKNLPTKMDYENIAYARLRQFST